MNVLLIAGSRTLERWNADALSHIFDNASYGFDVPFDKVISGGAKGIDTIAQKWAEFKQKEFQEYPADWNQWGKAAGPIRNKQMAEACTHAILVWDGKSRGTQNMEKELLAQRRPYAKIYVPINQF